MAEALNDSLRFLTQDDIRAMVAYLSGRRARVRANSFAEISAVEWFDVASPIYWQPPLFDIPMEEYGQ